MLGCINNKGDAWIATQCRKPKYYKITSGTKKTFILDEMILWETVLKWDLIELIMMKFVCTTWIAELLRYISERIALQLLPNIFKINSPIIR